MAILGYKFIDIPVRTQTGIPNPENFSSEAKMYEALQFIVANSGNVRTDVGAMEWTSDSSGITYNTNDTQWQSYPNIYNRGQEGMMNLLNEIYSDPTSGKGFIATADAINAIAEKTDMFEDGRLTVYNSLHLNGQPDTYYATQIDINKIKTGEIIAGNADKLDGFHADYFATKSYADTINTLVQNILNGTTKVPNAVYADTAGNANNFGGQPPSYYQPAGTAVNTYAGTTTPASSLGKNGDLYLLYA